MNQNPLNIVMLLLLIIIGGIFLCLRQSPDALEIIARKMRARARALQFMQAARAVAWEKIYYDSVNEDTLLDKERRKRAKTAQLVDSVEEEE